MNFRSKLDTIVKIFDYSEVLCKSEKTCWLFLNFFTLQPHRPQATMISTVACIQSPFLALEHRFYALNCFQLLIAILAYRNEAKYCMCITMIHLLVLPINSSSRHWVTPSPPCWSEEILQVDYAFGSLLMNPFILPNQFRGSGEITRFLDKICHEFNASLGCMMSSSANWEIVSKNIKPRLDNLIFKYFTFQLVWHWKMSHDNM